MIPEAITARLRARAESQIGIAAECYAILLAADLVGRIDPAAPLPQPIHDPTGLHLLALSLHYARDPDPPVAWRAAVGEALRAMMAGDPATITPLRLVAYDVAADQVEIGPPLREEWDDWVATCLLGLNT